MPRFLVHRIYASYCEEANVQDIYILDKMRVFFVEMYYVNSFKDIIYKKKRKKGKSTDLLVLQNTNVLIL